MEIREDFEHFFNEVRKQVDDMGETDKDILEYLLVETLWQFIRGRLDSDYRFPLL